MSEQMMTAGRFRKNLLDVLRSVNSRQRANVFHAAYARKVYVPGQAAMVPNPDGDPMDNPFRLIAIAQDLQNSIDELTIAKNALRERASKIRHAAAADAAEALRSGTANR